MEHVYHTELGEDRRVDIPAEVWEQLGLQPGALLAIKVEEDGLHLVPYEQIILEVQTAFALYWPACSSVVDELIRERRQEALREEHELEQANSQHRAKP